VCVCVCVSLSTISPSYLTTYLSRRDVLMFVLPEINGKVCVCVCVCVCACMYATQKSHQ